MSRKKKRAAAGSLMWIIGLVVFIVGLNLTGAVKEWMTVCGSVVFLAGLGIMGALWVIRKKEEEAEEGK